MSDFSEFATAQAAVLDPQTSATDLAAIVAAQPTLWADVAKHPNAYPALLTWLDSHGSEDVKMAVANRPAPSAPQDHTPEMVQAVTPVQEPFAQPAPQQGNPYQFGQQGAQYPAADAPLGFPASVDQAVPQYPEFQTGAPYQGAGAYVGAPGQVAPYSQPWGMAPAPVAVVSKKSRLPLILVTSVVVLALAGFSVWWFGFRSDAPTTPITSVQFNTLVTKTLPTKAGFSALTTKSPSKSSCAAQTNAQSHQLRIAESGSSQGVSLDLFDTLDWANVYLSQMKTCWEQNGNTVQSMVDTAVGGATASTMTVGSSGSTTKVYYFAVYRNVFIFTNKPTAFEPWNTWVKNVFIPAVDEAGAS
jgi:hypothetical protein